MIFWFYKNISPLCLILLCLIGIRRIYITPESFSKKYRSLKEEEKKNYDIHKIQRIGQLWFGSVILITTLFIIGNTFFSYINFIYIFVVLFVIDLGFYLLFSNTRWALNVFCKIRGE